MVASHRTSLVIEPSDGRVPVRPEAEKRREEYAAQERDGFEFMSPWDRCITRGIPGAFFPAGYNNAYQIVQAPGYVVIHYEMIHAARVIPTDNRKHLPEQMRFWDGDSVGHWEGNTLVVDITNYNGKGWIATNAASGRIRGIPQGEGLHVVERFTRTDQNTIDYQVTIDDPKVYTTGWKVADSVEPRRRLPDLRIRLSRGQSGRGARPARRPCSRTRNECDQALIPSEVSLILTGREDRWLVASRG